MTVDSFGGRGKYIRFQAHPIHDENSAAERGADLIRMRSNALRLEAVISTMGTRPQS